MSEEKDVSILYSKKFSCPICEQEFESMKLRESWLKIDKYETDLNALYHDVQPSFYQAIVCPYCGFSAIESKFQQLKPAQKEHISREIMGKWNGRSYSEERTLDEAILTWMLALRIAEVGNFSSIELGMYSLTIARLFRLKGDKGKEERFTKVARDKFIDTYSEVDYSGYPGMNEGNITYLIGELSRRIGDKNKASTYMGLAMNNEIVRSDPRLMEMTRDQWHLIKEME